MSQPISLYGQGLKRLNKLDISNTSNILSSGAISCNSSLRQSIAAKSNTSAVLQSKSTKSGVNLSSVAGLKLNTTKLTLNKDLKLPTEETSLKVKESEEHFGINAVKYNTLCVSPKVKARRTLGSINEKSCTDEKKVKISMMSPRSKASRLSLGLASGTIKGSTSAQGVQNLFGIHQPKIDSLKPSSGLRLLPTKTLIVGGQSSPIKEEEDELGNSKYEEKKASVSKDTSAQE